MPAKVQVVSRKPNHSRYKSVGEEPAAPRVLTRVKNTSRSACSTDTGHTQIFADRNLLIRVPVYKVSPTAPFSHVLPSGVRNAFAMLMMLASFDFDSTNLSAQTIQDDPALASQLRQKDVLLLRAAHTAEQGPWRQFAAPDFFYLDEEGGVTYLNSFLKELAPTATRPLEIQTYKITRAGDTAVVLHEDMDQNQVRYIFTETWQKLNGDWRLRVLHIANVLSDPPAIRLTLEELKQLVGAYHRGAATAAMRCEGDKIVYKRADGSEVELKAEIRDLLFIPGQPREQIIFLRNAAGVITGFVQRYETSDMLWSKEK